MKPPPADLRIDGEGRWFANGKPVIHEKILSLFRRSLVREGDMYLIRVGDEVNPVTVEDAPLRVRGLYIENTAEGLDIIRLVLDDGRTADLDPATLRATDAQSLYCTITETGLEAKFSREALSHFAKFLDHDAQTGAYFLELNGRRFEIGTDYSRGHDRP